MADGSLKQPLGDLVTWFATTALVEDDDLHGPSLLTLAVNLPIELSVIREADGRLKVLASPPTQRVSTTFLPVFHRMTVRVEREGGATDG